MIALKHRQVTYIWEVVMGQSIRSGNAYYPVDPDFDSLSLDHLLDPRLYIPRFGGGMYEGGQG